MSDGDDRAVSKLSFDCFLKREENINILNIWRVAISLVPE
jgi:hypothetical protein